MVLKEPSSCYLCPCKYTLKCLLKWRSQVDSYARLTTLGRSAYHSEEMAIRFKHGGIAFTADTPEEAAKLRALLQQQDTEAATERASKFLGAQMGMGGSLVAYG